MRNSMSNAKRVFVVGCSRSGTTLIQRCLANHPQACSFPETGYFRQLCGNKFWTKVTMLGLVRRSRVYRAFNRLFRVMPELKNHPDFSTPLIRTQNAVNTFIKILDNFCITNHKHMWIEKTPQHYRSCEVIKKYVEDSHIIHVVRDGRDVLGSIRNRALKYPDNFGRQYDPAHGIKEWNWAIDKALSQSALQNVYLLRFENFAAYPQEKIKRLCDEIGLSFDANMLNPGSNWTLKETREPWKSGIDDPIKPPKGKFEELFQNSERKYVMDQLNLHLLESIDKKSI